MRKPNLFIVGAAKSGTTSLHEYLSVHPNIYMSRVKEPHYYSQIHPDESNSHIVSYISDSTEYYSLFSGAKNKKYVGESSPSYLYEAKTAQRIYDDSPSAKIIIILREPIQRAYSHYLMDVREGIQQLDFFEALKADFRLTKKGWGVSHLYVELGDYYNQIKNYFDIFGYENVKVIFFEELVFDAAKVTNNICNFLSIETIYSKDSAIFKNEHNPFSMPRNQIVRYLMAEPKLRKILKGVIPVFFRSFLRRNILFKKLPKPGIDYKAKKFLGKIYKQDIDKLRGLLDKNTTKCIEEWENLYNSRYN